MKRKLVSEGGDALRQDFTGPAPTARKKPAPSIYSVAIKTPFGQISIGRASVTPDGKITIDLAEMSMIGTLVLRKVKP